jgi:50S ribosome-binding GTPase
VRVDDTSPTGERIVTVYPVSENHSVQPPRSSRSSRKPSLSSSWDSLDRDLPRPPFTSQKSYSQTAVSTIARAPTWDLHSEPDLIIMVMGMTGSGKSSFINLLSDQDVAVGHSLTSYTTDPELYSIPFGGNRRAFMIDTPGFDDTSRPDTEILKGIAFFLNALQQSGKRLAGLIYMHRITDVRMGGSAMRNLELFRRICGPSTFPHVALVSAMWGMLRGEEEIRTGEQREKTLLSEPKFWKDFADRRSEVMRHDGSKASALKVLHDLPLSKEGFMLDLQKEMMKGLPLNETTAGLFLEQNLNHMRKKYEQELRELQKELEEARGEKDSEDEVILHEAQRATLDKLRRADAEVDDLNLNAEALVREKAPGFQESLQRRKQLEMAQDATVKEQGEKLQRLQDEIAYLRSREKKQQQQIDALEREKDQRARSRSHHERRRSGRKRASRSPSPSPSLQLAALKKERAREQAKYEQILRSRSYTTTVLQSMRDASVRALDASARFVMDSLPKSPMRRASTEPSRSSQLDG